MSADIINYTCTTFQINAQRSESLQDIIATKNILMMVISMHRGRVGFMPGRKLFLPHPGQKYGRMVFLPGRKCSAR